MFVISEVVSMWIGLFLEGFGMVVFLLFYFGIFFIDWKVCSEGSDIIMIFEEFIVVVYVFCFSMVLLNVLVENGMLLECVNIIVFVIFKFGVGIIGSYFNVNVVVFGFIFEVFQEIVNGVKIGCFVLQVFVGIEIIFEVIFV